MRTIPMVTGGLTAIAIAFTATPASAVDHQAQVNDIADIIAEAAPTGDKPLIPEDYSVSGAACLAQFGTIVYVAGTGVNSRPMKCLVLKFSHTGGLATLPGTYRDSRCK